MMIDLKKLTIQRQTLDEEGLTVSRSTFRKSASMMARALVGNFVVVEISLPNQ